jgi:hypothetical protein
MTKKNWIKENRRAIDDYIKGLVPNIGSLNDKDRWDWVMNDEYLYNWARRSGVRV